MAVKALTDFLWWGWAVGANLEKCIGKSIFSPGLNESRPSVGEGNCHDFSNVRYGTTLNLSKNTLYGHFIMLINCYHR